MTHPSLAWLSIQPETLIMGVLDYAINAKQVVNRQLLAISLHLPLWAFLVLPHGSDRNNRRIVLQEI